MRKISLINSLLVKALLRGGIPFVLMSGISVILNFQNKTKEAKSTFLVSLIALAVGIATVIYDIDQWSLLKRSIIHFLCMLVTVYPILLISGWFHLKNFKDALGIFKIFILVGAIIYSLLLFLALKFKW